MQLSATTDYAIRIVLYLLEKKRVVKSSELSEQLGIPKTYVLKVTKKLEKDGLVKSYQGLNGGIISIKQASDISLWHIIKSTENNVQINKCLSDVGYCEPEEMKDCPVRKVYAILQKAVEDRLSSVKMIDLMNDTTSILFNDYKEIELGGE